MVIEETPSPTVLWMTKQTHVVQSGPLARVNTSSFSEDDIGSHSLQASGVAAAMYINRQDAIEIQYDGHWTSNTFMTYIHNQLDVVSKGLSQAMSAAMPYLNIAK